MRTTLELTPDRMKERIEQAEEMAEIWEKSDNPIHMYLKGCIVTAKALSESKTDG